MPPDWEDEDFWNDIASSDPNKQKLKSTDAPSVTLRPPLYNAEDYTTALKQHFSAHSAHLKNKPSVLTTEHSSSSSSSLQGNHHQHHNTSNSNGGFYEKNLSTAVAVAKNYLDHLLPETPPEMSMRNFLNGSELLFKLEADLRHAFPTFVQEFVSGQSEGVACLLETLKMIQASIDSATGLREQRKLFMDELKCLHCLRLCLRNIEAVSKLAAYPGGLYPLANAMISTVTTTRIIALEIMTCICAEGGPEGHFKVSEAISTLRLRMGEPIRCKLLVGAISSAPPGTFQAKGIKFLTTWISSASSPKQKVHIQCELEEAGFNPQSLRKGAELGDARESREVQAELDAWSNVAIDVDTLTRQNCQLRNSVATLQQELATLKDKIKKMDVPNDQTKPHRTFVSNGSSNHIQPNITNGKPFPKQASRIEELVTTPVDSEEEAEQIHQILEDLNNIVNSEMNQQQEQDNKIKKSQSTAIPKTTVFNNNNSKNKKEKEIVPIHLVKSPPPKKLLNSSPTKIIQPPRPWPSSSASEEDYYEEDDRVHDAEDDDSDIIKAVHAHNNNNNSNNNTTNSNIIEPKTKNVRQVIEQLEKQQQQQNQQISNNKEISTGNAKHYQKHNTKSSSKSLNPTIIEPKPDYNNPLPNFHKQNHMANKFINFKSSKLYSSSPDNSITALMSSSSASSSPTTPKSHAMRISPTLEKVQRNSSKIHAKQQAGVAPRNNNNNNAANNGRGSQLRRSESLHTSLTSIIFPKSSELHKNDKKNGKKVHSKSKLEVEKWKSVDNLLHNNENFNDEDEENFTLRWKYPSQQIIKSYPSLINTSPKSDDKHKKKQIKSSSAGIASGSGSPASSSGKSDKKLLNHPDRGVFELYTDYRQSRFACNGSSSPKQSGKGSPVQNGNSGGSSGLGTLNFFSRYSKKSNNNNNNNSNSNGKCNVNLSSGSGGSNSSGNSLGLIISQSSSDKKKKKIISTKNGINIDTRSNNDGFNNPPKHLMTNQNNNHHHNGKEQQSITMFSLPPIFVSQGIDIANHRICDLPSGLY